jgi:acyl-CoA dehydrogenase
MNFDDTREEAAFRAECRAWLAAAAPAHERGSDGPFGAPEVVSAARAWQAAKYDAGWACLTWPVAYGGRGAPAMHRVIFAQEEARFRVPPDLFLVGTGLAGPTLMVHADDAQKQRFLPKLARGDEIWCQLFSEPAAGSDLAAVRTMAARDGDGWVVSGQKIWTTGAHFADWAILLARTDLDAPKHAGLTYFVLDMHAPGIEVRPIREMTGRAEFNEVFLSDVRVPDTNRVSACGNGWTVALTTLMNERVTLGALSADTEGVHLRDLVALARRVGRGRQRAIDDPAVRQRLADFWLRARGLELLGYRSLTALSRGETPGPEGSLGKLVGGVLRQEMAGFALELEGPAGVIAYDGGSWQEAYLSSPGLRIAGGTDEILRNILAERVLALPPEPRLDKDRPFRALPVGSRPTQGSAS